MSHNVLWHSLADLASGYRAYVRQCRSDPAEEPIHDLRATIRRLLAALEAIDFVAPQRLIRSLSDDLKDQIDALDDLRDTQVMLAAIPEKLDILPELGPLQDYLQRREKRLLSAAEHILDAIDLPRFKQQVRKLKRSLDNLRGPRLPEDALQALDAAYARLMQFHADMDPAQPASIHQVRIAFRKFRFMIEALYDRLRGFPADNMPRMSDYQGRMGAIQDAKIFIETVDYFSSRENPYDLTPVRRYYQKRMDAALSAYLQGKDEITAFWRPNPAAPFPWQAAPLQEKGLPMKLYIVRHAIAVEPGTPGYEDDDSQRPLTGKGRKKMEAIARGLRQFGVDLDMIVTSPWLRARDTAQILADQYNIKKNLLSTDSLIPPGNFDQLVDEIVEKYNVDSLALVGHEPMLSQFISWLTSGSTTTSIDLKKGGVCYLSTDDLRGQPHATLEWLLAPAALIALSK